MGFQKLVFELETWQKVCLGNSYNKHRIISHLMHPEDQNILVMLCSVVKKESAVEL